MRELGEVPHFLRAQSPEGLRRAMLRENLLSKTSNSFFDISYANGEWIAWFYKYSKKINLEKREDQNDLPSE